MHPTLRSCILLLLPVVLTAQQRDTVNRLPDIGVSVTRSPGRLGSLGAAVSIVDSAELRRNRLAPTLDDALGFVPGVVIGNRWNYSLDQRLSIRGFGARANFGWRGVKVLIDGIPQTLPDGQSQLNHLDLSQVRQVEILRGAASAEYGNAAGGVLAFSSLQPTGTPTWTLGAEAGDFGSTRMQLNAAARHGDLAGTIAASRFRTDGTRQHAGAEQRRMNGSLSFILDPFSTVTARFSLADDPLADNPGALTLAEVTANRDSAAANNLRRNAGKAVTQSQLALGYRRQGDRLDIDISTWRLVRDLDNPLAAPPPPPAGPTEGTWVGLDRVAGGGRSTISWRGDAITATVGADLQVSRDDRINERSLAGARTGAVLVDQQETVREFGPFLHLDWLVRPSITLGIGARWDRIGFDVIDRAQLGGDGSGVRAMSAPSGSLSLGMALSPRLTLWSSVGTVFETPTTTELANQPSGATGLNRDLDPQRSLTTEIGLRGRAGALTWEAAAWLTTTHDAIVPAQDVGGRSLFQNAGETRTSGAEGTLRWQMTRRLQLIGTATLTHATFRDYRNAIDDVVLDGNQLAGLPERAGRIGLRGGLGRGIVVDIDQTLRGGFFADDANTLVVEGLRAGVTGVRLSWGTTVAATRLTTFASCMNCFDRRYIGSVSINGAAGRVFEPAPGRIFAVGMQVGR